jgi:argininosuccinate lyase
MKLWQKNTSSKAEVEKFTIGRDPDFDLLLAPFDVIASIAHATMLASINLISADELTTLKKGLLEIYDEIQEGKFSIQPGVEDVHSQVEFLLTERYGEVGKKLHSGRSRNDQVLVDLKLFYRAEIQSVIAEVKLLFDLLVELAEKHKQELMPGYTHTQLAMPSSFGLWFGSFAEALAEDMDLWIAAFNLANRNPLGSAAGYGSSFPLNRLLTTELLGFKEMHYNVINAQNSRGKTEKLISFAMAGVAGTLNKLATDSILFMNQHFGFIKFPDELTTGSSIMPHKKNPDVFELIRAKTNQLQASPQSLLMQLTNMSTGYHRDLQLLKETTFPDFEKLKDCLKIATFMLQHIEVKKELIHNQDFKHLFSVEEVNRLVLEGIPFRDAYKSVGFAIENDDFSPSYTVNHTHEGSIGQLCLEQISAKMEHALQAFDFDSIEKQLERLAED